MERRESLLRVIVPPVRSGSRRRNSLWGQLGISSTWYIHRRVADLLEVCPADPQTDASSANAVVSGLAPLRRVAWDRSRAACPMLLQG